jgi:hypothetical protein
MGLYDKARQHGVDDEARLLLLAKRPEVANCDEKAATMETQAPHAHRSNVFGHILKVVANGVRVLCMLFCIPESVESELCLLEVLEVMR